MECPFKTPAKYEMKITNTEYVVVDAERKVIAKCSYEDDALFIQNVINCHEKLVKLREEFRNASHTQYVPDWVITKFDKILKEAEKD